MPEDGGFTALKDNIQDANVRMRVDKANID